MINLTAAEDSDDLDSTVIDKLAQDTYTLINARLRGRYPVPFTTVPAEILQISDVITMQALYSRKGALKLSDGLARQYKTALDDLNAYRNGDQVLPGFESSTQHPAFIKTNKTTDDRIFSKQLLHAF